MRPPRTRLFRHGLLAVVLVVAGAVAWNLRSVPGTPPESARGPSPAREGTAIRDLSFFRFLGGEQKIQVKARAQSGGEDGVMHLEGVEVRFPFTARGEESAATVTADTCLYDTTRERARFRGNVHVVTDDGFELDTDELTYQGDKGRLRSDSALRFRRGGASGSARGMVYRTARDELQLDSDVRLRFEDAHGGPATEVEAQKARASRKTRLIRFQGDVAVVQGPRTLRSKRLLVTLDPELESIVRAVAIGSVDTHVVGALPGAASPVGGARRLRCQRLDVDFRAPGVLEEALADRNASLELFPGPGDPPEKRTIVARTLRFLFDEQGRLEALHGQNTRGSKRGPGRAERRAGRPARAAPASGGDEGKAASRPRRTRPGRASGVRGSRAPADGGEESPTALSRVVVTTEPVPEATGVPRRVECLRLSAWFDPQRGSVRSAELRDEVSFAEGSRRAWSQKAVYDESSATLTLTGDGPRIQDEAEGSELQAETIRLGTIRDEIQAEGGVRHTIAPRKGRTAGSFLGGSQPTILVSGQLEYNTETRTARYRDNALLRSGRDEIRAPLLVLEEPAEGQRRLLASGGTSSVLHPRPGKEKARDPAPVTTRSKEMVYEEKAARVVYTGEVEIRQGDIITLSPKAVVTLTPAGDDVEEMVAGEPVEVRQGARRATGRTGIYTLADETLVLVGDEVVLQDEGREVKGRALTFHVGEDRIRIDGREEVRTEAVFQTGDTPRP